MSSVDIQEKDSKDMEKKKTDSKKGNEAKMVEFDDIILPPAPNPEMLLDINSVFKLIDLYFKQKNIMYSHLHNSFDKFLDEDVKSLLKNNKNVFFEKITKDKVYRYIFEYENISIKPPTDNEDEIMFPSTARTRNMTYEASLVATITQIQEVTDIATGTVKRNIIGQPEYEYPIAIIPIMVRSKYCSLNIKPGQDKSEDEYDPGGYFIINGSEKVVMSLERMIDNKPLVFTKKDSNTTIYTVQVNSKSFKDSEMTQIITVRMKKDKILTIRVPIINEVPVFIIFRALGIESDRDIINMVCYDNRDVDMINLVRVSLENSVIEGTTEKIRTKEDAITYLTQKMRVMKKYSDTDKDVRMKEKKMHLESLLINNFLPHVEADPIKKAYYLGYMINRLLQCFLGRIPKDDRDSYVNKRVDLPGTLVFELFKQYYKKMLNECSKFFKRRNNDDEKPINIINQIKPNIIQQGLKGALSTGAWGKKKGVAQMLQRLSFLQTISSLRRINSPTVDASTNKLTSPRHLHNTQISAVCVTGDTEVLLSDGVTLKRIRDMNDSDRVLTVSKDSLSVEPSKIYNYFSKMPDKLLKITTLSGRVLKCTPDHPLLIKSTTGKYEMIKAGELKPDQRVIVRHEVKMIDDPTKTIIKLNSSDIDEQYRMDLLRLNLLNREFTQSELEIIARLVGLNVTDGHTNVRKETGYYDSCFSVGEEQDVFDLVDDIVRLGFDSPSIRRDITHHKDVKRGKITTHRTWKVSKGGAFAYLMHKMGAIIGDKTLSVRKVPDWIKTANKNIIREYLSGFQGGDGSRISLQNTNSGNRTILRIGKSGQTTINERLEDTIAYMKDIAILFNKFDIQTTITTEKARDDEDKTVVLIHPSDSIESLCRYADFIGYRYCNEKRRFSALPIEFAKCKQSIMDGKNEKYDKLIEFYNSDNKEIPISHKIKELDMNHKTAYRVIGRYNKTGDTIYPKAFEFEQYDEFTKESLEGNSFVSVKIKSIEEIPPELVYDFTTVSSNHSFIGNGFCMSNCYVETAEGHKVGLVKNLSMMGNVTLTRRNQVYIIKGFLADKLIDLHDISPGDLKTHTRVFLNGEWLGITNQPQRLYQALKKMKYNGDIDQMVSIIHEIKSDIESKEIRICCDGGRMYRPYFVVDNNTVKLTKEHIETIILKGKSSAATSANWNEFLLKNRGLVEYLDTDEMVNAMIAMFPSDVERMRQRQVDTAKIIPQIKIDDNHSIANRYDDFVYVTYTHCEIHPSMMIGAVVANIPFSNHNQGPRNIYQYSQARQAMGIYASNYRDRLDISYILYYAQRPLVTTRLVKYINTDSLPTGENAVVAIACYTGFNVDDSVIISQSAVDRGLYITKYVKKYITTVQKNQSTSQDDVFTKPDRSKVAGMRHGSYDKLNDQGYVPEETTIENGDIIMAKISPIQPIGTSDKTFKDNSEQYKSHVAGVVDRVWTEIYNHEGYEMRKMRVRSERIPIIGDKFCSRHSRMQCLIVSRCSRC